MLTLIPVVICKWLTMGTLFAVVSSSVIVVQCASAITVGMPFPDVPPQNDHHLIRFQRIAVGLKSVCFSRLNKLSDLFFQSANRLFNNEHCFIDLCTIHFMWRTKVNHLHRLIVSCGIKLIIRGLN